MARHAELLPRYRRLRQAALPLNSRLVETLSKSVLREGGKKLGLLQRNVLALDSEDEMTVLMDYCIYDVRRNGLNAVDRYLAKSPPPQDSDEWTLLQGMRQAYYSLFVVEERERGVGVHVKDLLRDESRFLMDVGLSRSGSRGLVIATRVLAPDGIGMTGGAVLPVARLAAGAHAAFLKALAPHLPAADFHSLSPHEASNVAGAIIRVCLQAGAAEHVAYIEPKAERGSEAAPP